MLVWMASKMDRRRLHDELARGMQRERFGKVEVWWAVWLMGWKKV